MKKNDQAEIMHTRFIQQLEKLQTRMAEFISITSQILSANQPPQNKILKNLHNKHKIKPQSNTNQ